jgi:hypothetical protein
LKNDSKTLPAEEESIFKHSFALIKGQWLRMLLLNFFWAIQAVPLLMALVFSTWPYGLRIGLSIYSVLALVPATAALYATLDQVSDGAQLSFGLVRDCLKAQFTNAYLKLLPLYSLFFWLLLVDRLAINKSLFVEATLVRLVILILGILSLYWGPAMVNVSALSAIGLFIASYKLLWHRPGKTLLASLYCLLSLVLGVVTIVGMLLIAPVLVVLIQIQLFRAVTVKK